MVVRLAKREVDPEQRDVYRASLALEIDASPSLKCAHPFDLP